MTRLGLATIIAAVALVGLAGVALATTHNEAGPSLRSDALALLHAMQGCAVTVRNGETVPLADIGKLDLLIGRETQACIVKTAVFKQQGHPALAGARQIGRRALFAAKAMIGDLMAVETYERWPQDDPGQQHLMAYTLKSVTDEQTFLRGGMAFTQAMAQALHIRVSAL